MKTMTGTTEKEPLLETLGREGSAHGPRGLTFDALRVRAQQLSLREQWSTNILFWRALMQPSGWLI